MPFPPEIFSKIVSYLDGDIHTLYSCSLVNRGFHNLATPLLYKRIHVSPPKAGLAWQIVEDTLGRKPFAASRLPTHCAHVREFILDGYITKVRPSRQIPTPIIHRIPEVFRSWSNLRSVTLIPQRATDSVMVRLVEALQDCSSLRILVVNETVMEEETVLHLGELVGLQKLSLVNPTRAMFLILRDWLDRNQDTLVELKLMGNCGSLTPGILRKIVPCLSKIHAFAIGLSYSLSNADVFGCLSQLSQLRTLHLRYYRQHKALPSAPDLPALKCLVVLHATLHSKDEAVALSAWIRRLTSLSAALQSLETKSCGPSGPCLCFDGLASHIASRHHATLNNFRMPTAYVRGPAFHTLLNRCSKLQQVSLTVAFSTLQAFPTMTGGFPNLQTVSLDVCDRPKLVLEKKDALKVMGRVPQLRCITVRNVTWKGIWVAQQDKEGHVHPEFVVSLIPNIERDEPLDCV